MSQSTFAVFFFFPEMVLQLQLLLPKIYIKKKTLKIGGQKFHQCLWLGLLCSYMPGLTFQMPAVPHFPMGSSNGKNPPFPGH